MSALEAIGELFEASVSAPPETVSQRPPAEKAAVLNETMKETPVAQPAHARCRLGCRIRDLP